ncbi:DUF6686 family protein [Psychroflexus gondwanensis]
MLKRKIPIQKMKHTLAMVFYQQELESLMELICWQTKNQTHL